MRTIAPRLRMGDERTVAEDQLEFRPAVAAFLTMDDGSEQVWMRWTMTPEERERIASGEDIYLAFVGAELPPHRLTLRPDWAE